MVPAAHRKLAAQSNFSYRFRTHSFPLDPQPLGDVHVFIANDGRHIPRRDAFKVATRFHIPHFYFDDIHCRAQNLE